MKDGLKSQRAEPRAEEKNRWGSHFQKAEMNSSQGIFLDAEVKKTDNICLDFKIVLDQ